MLEFLHRAIVVDTYTLVVVALLAGWGGVLTRDVLSRTALALVFVPGFVLGALFTSHLFELAGFSPTPDRQTNIVVACTLGMVGALFVLLLILRATSILSDARLRRHEFKRDLKQHDAPFRRGLRGV